MNAIAMLSVECRLRGKTAYWRWCGSIQTAFQGISPICFTVQIAKRFGGNIIPPAQAFG
jgi:hypothetical protein